MIDSLTRRYVRRRHVKFTPVLTLRSFAASLPHTRRVLTRCLLLVLVVLTILFVYQDVIKQDDSHMRTHNTYTIGVYANRSGLRSGRAPLESTILMLFTSNTNDSHTSATIVQDYDAVAEAYLSSYSSYVNASGTFADFVAQRQATLWEVNETTRVARPMRLDVVLTHVEPEAASFAQHVHIRQGRHWSTYIPLLRSFAPHHSRRFRNWQELRYALRALHVHALHSSTRRYEQAILSADCAFLRERLRLQVSPRYCGVTPDTVNDTLLDDDDGVRTGSLIRYVYLVVADMDQVPHWLNRSAFPALRVILHTQLFTQNEATVALPTMNSLSIETTLHRIPGLSRFFLYFNDDMLLGRRLALFDLFRPLSLPRQLLHLRHVQLPSNTEAVSQVKTDMHKYSTNDTRAIVGQWLQQSEQLTHYEHASSFPHTHRRRGVVWLEPVLHSDGWAAPNEPLPSCDDTPYTQVHMGQCNMHASPIQTHSVRTAQDACVWPAVPTLQHVPRAGTRHVMDRYAHYLTRSALEGVASTITYAHVPSVLDRNVLKLMLEHNMDGFAQEAAVTRRAFVREKAAFSPMHFYPAYDLAMRRARTRHLWWQVTRPFVKDNASQHTAHRHYCTLCGDTNAIHLQRPDLFYHLCRHTSDSMRHTTLDLCARVQRTVDDLIVSSRTSKNMSVGERRAERWKSLRNDVYHHAFDDDDETMFVMARDALHLSIVLLSLQDHIAQHGAPLFTTLNDDFHGAQMRQGQAVLLSNMQLFALYMRTATNATTPAPWEQ